MEDIFKEMIIKRNSLPFVHRKEGEVLTHRYEGIPFQRIITVEALNAMKTFEVRSDDIFLVTYPKAGTTWTQEIISMVMSGANEEELSKTHLVFRFPFLEINWASHYSQCDEVPCVYKYMDKIPSPRTIKTHLSKDLLPPQAYTKKPKIIYVARNPKDLAVSFYNMHKHFNTMTYYSDFTSFFEDFMKREVHCGSWYDHTLFWWRKRHEPNVLFLKYEDMKRDLRPAVLQIAEFINCSLSDEALNLTVNHCSFANMKKNQSANPDYLDTARAKKMEPNASFIRKGTVGDWKNYFTVAQNEAFDADYEARMKGSGLHFDFELNQTVV